MANQELLEWYQCPYCYRELHCTEIGLEMPKPEPRKSVPQYERRPSPKRCARMKGAINYLRKAKAPYYVRADRLHEFVARRFDLTKPAARRVARDLRHLCRDVVGVSCYRQGFLRYYWHASRAQQIPPEIRRGN